MADIDDSEQALAEMQGVENSWAGRVLVRLVRAVRFSHARIGLLTARTQSLEDRVDALEKPPPP